ncbi:hypothetical protein AB0D60_36555 [Streptomyces sp. NPDC048306]|uniref:hypothetical protein n=1 Tax=Streptomyces sp. NPDC048306 TaxID=3154502 RepID=UPI0033EFA039
MRDEDQVVSRTGSRRSGPRRWLRSVEWLVAAGLHPQASATTVAVARDLAARMDFDTGEVRYCLVGMVERLGLSRATVSRHVAYLREMGSLVWAERGSRANVRRSRGLKGYAATATVYAAVIPAVYDRALGHTIVGSGYTARIIVDRRDTTSVSADLVEAVDNPPVENRGSGEVETPSLTVVKEVAQVQVVGGKDSSTEQARTAGSIPRRKKRKLTILGYKITADRIDRARKLAVSVRPLVNWVQGATHDQLSWVMLDMVAKDWSQTQILLWLRDLGQELGVRRWRPRFPHRVIAAAMRCQDHEEVQRAHGHLPSTEPAATAPNDAFRHARETLRNHDSGTVVSYGTYGEHDTVTLNQWEAAQQQEALADFPELVLAAAQIGGRKQAIAAYGTEGARILDLHTEFQTAGLTWPAE